MNPDERFAAPVDAVAAQPGVTLPGEPGPRGSSGRRFGASALKVDGAIFAMLTGGRLVVKLPRDRVADLIAGGAGGPFDAGKGTPMGEWLTVAGDDEDTWLALTREAFAFVGSRARR